SSDQGGTLCRNWANTYQNIDPANVNQAMNQYCSSFPESEDCACINRNSDPLYQTISVGLQPNYAACYWIPCSSSNNFLTPSNIRNTTCDQQQLIDICNIVDKNISDNGLINIDEASNVILCLNQQGTPPNIVLY